MFFNSGGSSAKTMAALQRFNGVVSWLCHATIGITPEYITAGQARKEVNLKIPRGQKAKPVVLQFVLDNDPTFSVQYTKHGNPRPECFDKADSWVIAKSAYIEWLKKKYPLKEIGYSGHEYGLVSTFASVAMGARWVERHVTLDRNMWGSDQQSSVEPAVRYRYQLLLVRA